MASQQTRSAFKLTSIATNSVLNSIARLIIQFQMHSGTLFWVCILFGIRSTISYSTDADESIVLPTFGDRISPRTRSFMEVEKLQRITNSNANNNNNSNNNSKISTIDINSMSNPNYSADNHSNNSVNSNKELGTYSWNTVGLIDPAGAIKSHQDICQSILEIITDQRRICMRSQRVLTGISLGAKIGKEECQHHFRNNRWNCTSISNVVCGDVLSIKSRETAYIHAINSAALAWSVTRACSKGDLAECSCDNSIRRKTRKWQWGKCSEDINYGVMFSRKLIDLQESNTSIALLMNLHKNEAGRRAIRSRMQRVCKCHGMSGSCSVRVCWRRLPSIRSVGEALGQLYDGASYVKLVERDGKASKLRRLDPELKKLIKSDLVYLDESPDYCERQEPYGILGTKGRLCNLTSHGIDGCRLLCCGRGYQTRIRHVEEKCRCRFVWCCHVKCEMCNYKREEHICN